MSSKNIFIAICCFIAFFLFFRYLEEDVNRETDKLEKAWNSATAKTPSDDDTEVCLRYFIALNYAELEYNYEGEFNDYVNKYFRTLMKMKYAGIGIEFYRKDELKDAYERDLQQKLEENSSDDFTLYDQMFFKTDVLIETCKRVIGVNLEKFEATALETMYFDNDTPQRPTLKFRYKDRIDGYDIYSVHDYDSSKTVIFKTNGERYTLSYNGLMQTSDL